jgi:hypothetical protein
MSEAARFQEAFGAAMARPDPWRVRDPALVRALTIHRNTSSKAAQDAVLDNYPVVRALVGEAAFRACAHAFVESHPPREPRLCLYGAGLDGFLRAWTPFVDLDWLPDIAALERLVTQALFAADATALDGAALAARLDPGAPLTLHPATRFAAFRAPAAEIWLAHQADAAADALDAISWRPGAALVTRPEGMVRVTSLSPAALALLTAAAAGLPLAEIAEAALSIPDAAPPDLSALFAELIIAGAFA